MDDQVRFSILRLEVFQELEVTTTKKARNFGKQLADAFKGGIDGFLDFALFLVRIWPFILLFALGRYFRGRIRWRFWSQDNRIMRD